MKKLTRSQDRIIGGVCKGFAEYIGIDSIIVRVLLAVSFLVYGTGGLLYIILWIVIPEENKKTDFMKLIESKMEKDVKYSFTMNIIPGVHLVRLNEGVKLFHAKIQEFVSYENSELFDRDYLVRGEYIEVTRGEKVINFTAKSNGESYILTAK